MPYPNEHACRLKDPGSFKDDSFRRTSRTSKSNGKKYTVIVARLKSNDQWEDQAFRYKKSSWDTAEARSHCNSHNGKFEAASGS